MSNSRITRRAVVAGAAAAVPAVALSSQAAAAALADGDAALAGLAAERAALIAKAERLAIREAELWDLAMAAYPERARRKGIDDDRAAACGAIDERTGLAAVRREIEAVHERVTAIEHEIAVIPAATPAGIATKLRILVETRAARDGDDPRAEDVLLMSALADCQRDGGVPS
jgi:hypothetical protein